MEHAWPLCILAGERSGDAYGAAVCALLRAQGWSGSCFGFGGDRLEAAGCTLIDHHEGYDVMGFLPVIQRYGDFVRLGRRLEKDLRQRRPQVLFGIDYPGFNIRFYQRLDDLRRRGLRIVHLVAPQVWAWRPRRAKRIAQAVDHLLCFFPFEPPLFTRFGCRASFVGHPLVDLVDADALPAAAMAPPAVLLAPGGRRREVEKLLPIMVAAGRLLQQTLRRVGADCRLLVSVAPGLSRPAFAAAEGLELVEGDYRRHCRQARVGAIASGTASLEAALCGLPHVVCYRLDRVSALAARHLMCTPWVGLPNIVHGSQVLPELLQDHLTPTALALALLRQWQAAEHARLIERLGQMRGLLGGGGAMQRVATVLAAEARIQT